MGGGGGHHVYTNYAQNSMYTTLFTRGQQHQISDTFPFMIPPTPTLCGLDNAHKFVFISPSVTVVVLG